MSRSAVGSVFVALVLSPVAFAQSGVPKVPGSGKVPGTPKVPGGGPASGVPKVPGSIPNNYGPWAQPAPMPPVFFVGNPYGYGGVNPIIGQMTDGYYAPVAGGGMFVGSRQPYVAGAYGGPAFIQLPRFSEASVVGGVGGGVVSDRTFTGDRLLGGRVTGTGAGGVAIGPGGVSGFNSLFNSGIALGLNGMHGLGGNGGFLQWQTGPQGPAVPKGGATAVNGRIGQVGFNLTGGIGSVFANHGAFSHSNTGLLGRNHGNVGFGGGIPGAGGVGGGGVAAPPRGAGPNIPPSAKQIDRLRSPPDMTWWAMEMWKSPGSQGHFNKLGLDNKGRIQLFGYTLELMRNTLADFQPVTLPDGTTVQLQSRTLMVVVSADGKTKTGWLMDQTMPEVFEPVAMYFYKAADPTNGK